MPITIRPSVVKIKKPSTGEYREINALLDTDSAKTVYYGVSSTAADTQTKTVTIEGISALSDGLLVRILFANAQSYSGVPKLMINSTAASNIKTRRGTDATNLTWKAGDVLDFVYDSSSSGFIVLDKGDIEDLNDAITSAEKGLAIIVTGDTCSTAVPSGGYAYIKNNTHGLTEGLYRNKTASAFPTSGGTANSTVFEAVPDGGLNDVFKVENITSQVTLNANVIPDNGTTMVCRFGKIITVFANVLRTTNDVSAIISNLPMCRGGAAIGQLAYMSNGLPVTTAMVWLERNQTALNFYGSLSETACLNMVYLSV